MRRRQIAQRVAMSPSPRSTRSDWDNIGGPPVRVGSTLASIASKIVGTPAMTWTLPSVKPGAAEIGLSIRMAPSGTCGHAQAGVVHLHPLPVVMGLQDRAGVVANVQMRAHRLGHGIGGDVVMGRADPAGGEEVIVADDSARTAATIRSCTSATMRTSSSRMP
jgi:hypothetical protein